MTLDILNIVQLGREWVLDVDDEDLPVGLAFIKESHDAEDFNLLNLPYITHLFADLADVQRIVVAVGLGLAVLLSRILPSLGESTVVPNVPVVGEAVAHIAQTTLLDVLLDGVERLLLGDFHLGIGPAGNLDDHVEDAIVPICKERDVMERRDDLAVLLDVDAVFEGVGSADEPRAVLGHGGRREEAELMRESTGGAPYRHGGGLGLAVPYWW